MHTIVVHLEKKLHDWYLIEPFFYKGQSIGVLSFLEMPLSQVGVPNYQKLQETLNDYLYRNGIDDWQLVFILSTQKQHVHKFRLNSYLYYIQKDILKPLKQKRLYPDQTSLLYLDSLQNKEHEQVEDYYHQLDTQGFLNSGGGFPHHNMFIEPGVKRLIYHKQVF
ncbi:hypothetical protein [Ornithinibacillus halophilus]|uniref:Uncharacterized protein n=1 Tax=Ornithinibacillus halophilus TaxID=930117 RepID=A0A1M5GR28_9BACI|nr:hypothetical protein [Ornithinibacillus halophilus]SHG06186.1 hypothetical protein SAMN05216225_101421 [Ornithinibacillus halophilus]